MAEQSHDYENSEGRMQDVNVPLILTIGVISSLLLIVIVFGLQAWYHFEAYQERQQKVYSVQPRELADLQSTQLQSINTYHWTDRENELAAVPIERAMKDYVQQHQQGNSADTNE